MKNRDVKLIIVVITICIPFFLIGINTYIGFNSTKISVEHNYVENLKTSTTFNTTEINDFPGSLNNWSWAKSQGICSGSGTELDPYVIDGHIFPSMMMGDCLRIVHSRKYFTIINCEFRNAPSVYSGIFIANTTNGEITNNEFYGNKYGIYALSMNDTLISENHIYSNYGDGIFISNSYGNTISNNNLSLNGWQGIWMQYSARNKLTGNIACNNNFSGIYLSMCDDCTVNDNVLNDNVFTGLTVNLNMYAIITDNEINENSIEGIYFYSNFDSKIIRNSIQNNGDNGIKVEFSNQSIISENTINNNSAHGIYLDANTNGNDIFLNCFNNTINAYDSGSHNHWDNGIKGNYWGDYSGLDADNDGFGDIPYNITGPSGSQDNFPFMECPSPLIEAETGIPGYNLFIVISVITTSIGIIWVIKRKKLS